MRIIYLDTTTPNLYFTIIDDSDLLIEKKVYLGNEMSVNTLPIIKKSLEEVNLNIKEIDKIIVVNGPGSFTGTRICLTIAKTLAWSLNIPIVTISSLEAMAISYKGDKRYVVPMIDARRDHVYGTIYDREKKEFILGERYINLKTLFEEIAGESSVDYISNDDIKIEKELIKYTPDFLSIAEYLKNKELIKVHLVDANYLKLTEAEEKLAS